MSCQFEDVRDMHESPSDEELMGLCIILPGFKIYIFNSAVTEPGEGLFKKRPSGTAPSGGCIHQDVADYPERSGAVFRDFGDAEARDPAVILRYEYLRIRRRRSAKSSAGSRSAGRKSDCRSGFSPLTESFRCGRRRTTLRPRRSRSRVRGGACSPFPCPGAL